MKSSPVRPATRRQQYTCPAPTGAQLRLLSYISVGFVVCVGAFLPDNSLAQSLSGAGETGNSSFNSTASLVRLRGTTGSGEQDAVFEEEIGRSSEAEEMDDPELEARDTSDPVRQLQGRVLPVPAEAPVVDPLSVGTPSPRSNIRAGKAQDGTGRALESDPFAPTGFRIGAWRANTSLEQTVGYSSNIEGVAMGDPGAFSQTDLDFSLQSDWSRHSARIDGDLSYRTGLNSDAQTVPAANLSAGLTLDLMDGVSADFGSSYGYTTESVTSTTITSNAASRPGVHSVGGFAAIARTGRRLGLSLRGSVGRTIYEDIELTGGGSESQDDRNNTLYTLTGRASYEVSPAIIPFVELEAGIRDLDLETDSNGDNRNSVIGAARAGVAVDLGEKLNGELAMGYRVEDYEGANLENLASLTLDGNLNWSPVRETTISLTSSTSFSGSTTAGQNGSVVFDNDLRATRQINDRLSLEANAGVAVTRQDDGSRTDTEWTLGAGFNYWINRFMAVTGSLEHTNVRSSLGAPQQYDDTTFRTGIKLQR